MTSTAATRGAVDVALAAVAGFIDISVYSSANGVHGTAAQMAFTVAYTGIAFVALLVRRRYPKAVFVVVLAHSVLAAPLSGFDFRPTIGLCLALFTAALYTPPAVALAFLVLADLQGAWGAVLEATSRPEVWGKALLAGLVVNLMQLTSAWAAGRWMCFSRQHADLLEARRESEAREAVLEERARIAREMHDIVSHAVTVIVLQSAGGRRIIRHDIERAERAFTTIEHAGEQAMDELRRMLCALRPGRPDQEPRPGTADLRQLVDSFRATGVTVHVHVEGEPRPLASSVDLTVYRIVQEALTNVSKHAGNSATAHVRQEWTANHLEITVTDDGGRAPSRASRLSTRNGLRGLEERLAILGGELTATSTGDGFQLVAVIPLTEAQAQVTS